MFRFLLALLMLSLTLSADARICDRRPHSGTFDCLGCDGLTVAYSWWKDQIWCGSCDQFCPPLHGQEKSDGAPLTCESSNLDIPDGFVTALKLSDEKLKDLTKINPYIGTRLHAFIPTPEGVPPLQFPGIARTVWQIDETSDATPTEKNSLRVPIGEYIEVTGEIHDPSANALSVIFTARHYFRSGDALVIGPRISVDLIKTTEIEKTKVIDYEDKFATLYEVTAFEVVK